jgi:hypothetical protein
MFDDIDQLKQFIVWAKSQKLARVKVGDIEFDVSNIGLIEASPDIEKTLEKVTTVTTKANLSANEQEKEDEELLYWSSRNS